MESPTRSARLPRCRRAGAVVVAVMASVLLLAAPPANAHDQLVESHPAAGETVTVAPQAIVLSFSADVSDLSTEIVVHGPSGDLTLDSASGVVVEGPTVTAPLPTDLVDGPYTAVWRVVSADGHPVEGELAFTLLTPAPAPSAAPSSTATLAATATPVRTATPTAAAPTGGTSTSSTSDSNAPVDASTGWILAAVGISLVGAVTTLVVRRRRSPL